jgi:NTE family protein
VRRFRVVILAIIFFSIPSLHLLAQAKLVFRPKFDLSISKYQNRIYPFNIQKRPRVGLVLSGGGARGAAQIGVLKAMEDSNIPIDFISATSMGAVIGGLYASGYTSAEIESLALQTDWDELLSFSNDANRRDLAIDQKLADDWSFLVVRFQGLQPLIPHAVSSGQRLTNFLSEETLQALYHPNPSFDDLKIPFRAVTTDLISGKRITLDRGSLAEALRASSTVPLLFSPINKDSMQLIDGGLVTNIPVDVAKGAGCDVVVAVNSTSGLRNAEELKAPWQTADQIMGIMMQLSNQEQMKLADIAILPAIGRHLSSDFKGLDSLIAKGYRSAEHSMDSIKVLYQRALDRMDSLGADGTNAVFDSMHLEIVGEGVPDSLVVRLKNDGSTGSLSSFQIRRHIRTLFSTGNFRDIVVEVIPESRRIVFKLEQNPVLKKVEFAGNKILALDLLEAEFKGLIGTVLNQQKCSNAIERVLRLYRDRGYSLARVAGSHFDETSGTLQIELNEGVIEAIRVRGGERTEDSFVLREFGLQTGEVFEIEKAKQGVTNLNSTKVFEYVYLEVSFLQQKPVLTIRLAELPSQLIRLGMRVDDERKLQGTLDIRDENFRGIGTDLGLTISGGGRNGYANLEFKTNRLFSRYFTFNLSAFASVFNSNVYVDDPKLLGTRSWERDRVGEYSDVRLGGRLVVGSQLERLGSATIEWSLQNSRIKSVENMNQLEERYTLSLIKIGTVIDSRNSYPFPTEGVNLKLSYEFASKNFLSDVGYNAIRLMYESYKTFGGRSTLHPRLILGLADLTMPLGQQFRLGGRESMWGTREDDRRGRQLLAVSFEYRYMLPLQFVFDMYFRIRYDLASISEIPEQIKFTSFRHGVGAELAFDTPLGQAALGAGKSFYFDRTLPGSPIREGPLLFYFVLGYEL